MGTMRMEMVYMRIAMRGTGITDFFLQSRNPLPVHRLIEMVPWIEVQHIGYCALGRCPKHASDVVYTLLVIQEPRMQLATDIALSADGEFPGNIRGEGDGVHRL